MKWLRKWLSPPTSLVVVADRAASDLEEAVAALRVHYRPVTVTELAKRTRAGEAGLFALVFPSVRKGALLQTIPRLVGDAMPITLFLEPESVGTNRLPPEEEALVLADHYRDPTLEAVARTAWSDPEEASRALERERRRLGPLPLDQMDPARFFPTWGQLGELPPDLVELGLHVYREPTAPGLLALRAALEFTRARTGRPVTSGFLPRGSDSSGLTGLAIEAAVVPVPGQVTRDTDPMSLPVWRMSLSGE